MNVLDAQSEVCSKSGENLLLTTCVHLDDSGTGGRAPLNGDVDDVDTFTGKCRKVSAPAVIITDAIDCS